MPNIEELIEENIILKDELAKARSHISIITSELINIVDNYNLIIEILKASNILLEDNRYE